MQRFSNERQRLLVQRHSELATALMSMPGNSMQNAARLTRQMEPGTVSKCISWRF